jgi:hypothetical protein
MSCRQINNEEVVDLAIPFRHHVQPSQIKQLFTNWVKHANQRPQNIPQDSTNVDIRTVRYFIHAVELK